MKNKNFNAWIPWIILAAVVAVILLYVDYGKIFKSDQTVEEQIEALSADVQLDDLDDDDEFEEATNDGETDDFID